MTENLLERLEEKVVSLVAEIDHLRKMLGQVRQENTHLKKQQSLLFSKLGDLVSLLDGVDASDELAPAQVNLDFLHHVESFATT